METTSVNIKDIVANGTIATISHVIAGVVYYKVIAEKGSWMFPVDMNDREDVGTTSFNSEEKAITLMRYIRKAIDSNSLIQLK